MNRHTIGIKDFEDYSFEQVLASDSSDKKRLIVLVRPEQRDVGFKVTKDGKDMMVTTILKDAIICYNKL